VPSLAEEIREALEREAAENFAELPSEDLQARFAAAAAWVGEAGSDLSTEAKLRLYGCYKQVSAGDAPPDRPWGMEASMKWDAWHLHRGCSRGEAMKRYVEALASLAPGWESSGGAAASAAGGKHKADGSSGLGASVSTMGRLGDPDQADDVDETPVGQLCEKIAEGDVEEASAILARHPDLAFQKDKDGMFPLHWAADRGELEVARVLIQIARKKSSEALVSCLNAPDASGDTPLHYAVNTDNVELARLLVTSGADQSAKNEDGESPEDLADGQDGWDSVFNRAA